MTHMTFFQHHHQPVALQTCNRPILFPNNHIFFEKSNLYAMALDIDKNPVIFDGDNFISYEDVITTNPCTYLGLSFLKPSLK